MGLIVLSIFNFQFSIVFAQDYSRLSERTIMGTARYVGMGGAMSAIGADPSAVLDNVAGLGLYRRFEASITLDYTVRSLFMAPQASAVFAFPTGNPSEQGLQYHNFMVGYHRVHGFSGTYNMSGNNMPSLGALFALADGNMGFDFGRDRYAKTAQINVVESGYVNEYSFDWATNISNRWYVGIGLRVNSYSMSSQADYVETFNRQNLDLQTYYNRSYTKLLMNGAGCAFAAGLIARPVSWLRLGLGIQTPSFGSLAINTTGTFDARTDSLRWGDAPDLINEPSDFHMPLHLSTSIAFQVSRYALIAFQYDYRHFKYVPDQHSLRAGVEAVPIAGLYLNAGYAFESAFRNTFETVPIDQTLNRQDAYFMYPRWQQYISGAVGYRGRRFFVQAAYQYRLRHVNLYTHENAEPFDWRGNTHRIILTLGWHSQELK